MATRPAGAEGRYVYCVIPSRTPRSFGPIGIGGRGDEVYTLHCDGLAAVVSASPLEAYDPDRENLLAHERVNETVLREFTVLPLAFGSVFRSEEDVVALMRRTYAALEDTLQRIAGKVEFDVKVHWDADEVLRRIERETPELARLREYPGSASHLSRIEVGRYVEGRVKARAEGYVREIQAALTSVSVATHASETFGESMILNAAFLIERAEEERFAREMERLGERFPELTLRWSGPWPPYNFVRISVQAGQDGA